MSDIDINLDLDLEKEKEKIKELERKVDKYKRIATNLSRQKTAIKQRAETKAKMLLGGLFFDIGFDGKLNPNLIAGILAEAKENLDNNTLNVEQLIKKGKKALAAGKNQNEKTTEQMEKSHNEDFLEKKQDDNTNE